MHRKVIPALVMGALLTATLTTSAQASTDQQILKDDSGHVYNINGQLGHVSGQTPEQRALAALDKLKDHYGFTNAQGSFQVKQTHQDENGTAHTKLDRVINGISVLGQEMIVHEANGDVQGITGSYSELTPNTDHATLKEKDAIQAAVTSTGYTGDLSRPATAKLTYFAQGEQAVLTYVVNVAYLGDAPANWMICVDAQTGDVLTSLNMLANYTNATGTGTGVLGDTKTINTSLYTSTYYLEDHTKPMSGDIETYTMKFGAGYAYYMTDSDNNWSSSVQRAGVDAHYYAGRVYDYLYDKLGHNSYDGQGSSIYSFVHYSTNYNNAFWDGQEMVYGDGDGTTFRSFSGGLDVVAHELYHGVTEHLSGMNYAYQSGALNESWSDAFGATLDSNDWQIGEDIYTPGIPGDALRDMSNPLLYSQPMNMSGYVNTTSDNGGVHTNSGIPNYVFYQVATCIGSRDMAFRIWHVANRDYMVGTSSFSGARAATIQASTALYGDNYYGPTACVANAWSNVGVY